MHSSSPLSITRSERALQSTLALLWFGVIPALLAALLLRFAWPSPLTAESEWLRALAAAPFVAGALLFALLAALFGYWRRYLPGGRYLGVLPPSLAQQLAMEDIADFAAASTLRLSIATEAKRTRSPLSKLNADERARLASYQTELDAALIRRDRAAVDAAQRGLLAIAKPALRARDARNLFTTLLLLGGVAGAALLVRGQAFQICRVLSSSMLPVLEPGDYLLAKKISYSSSNRATLPKRGTIVVFRRASEQGTDELIKRVIGLPGDVVAAPNGFPTINGWVVPHCDAGRYTEVTPQGTTDGRLLVEFLEDQVYLAVYTPLTRPAGEYAVKPGEVFVFGDNRNESLDSRVWDDGKPSGLALSDIDGEVTQRLSDVRRDQTPTFGRFLQRLDLTIRVQGVDSSKLQAGIARCLASPPSETHPPEASVVRQ
ncbi:MAG TPA: signal peptidase I [Polyangiaceae bacterium]